MTDWFRKPMGLLIHHPWMAWVAGALGVLGLHGFRNSRRRGHRPAWLLGLPIVLWTRSGADEQFVVGADANIRIEVFVVTPVLVLTTAAGLAAWARVCCRTGSH